LTLIPTNPNSSAFWYQKGIDHGYDQETKRNKNITIEFKGHFWLKLFAVVVLGCFVAFAGVYLLATRF
jgi:hypothetical protein